MVSVDVKHHVHYGVLRVKELCESRGCRPGLSVLTSLTVSVDVKHHVHYGVLRVKELCESRGGRPGLSVLTSLTVSMDAKQHWTMLRALVTVCLCQPTSEDAKLCFIIMVSYPQGTSLSRSKKTVKWSYPVISENRHNSFSCVTLIVSFSRLQYSYNNNGYLEHLTHTGPKRLYIL